MYQKEQAEAKPPMIHSKKTLSFYTYTKKYIADIQKKKQKKKQKKQNLLAWM